MSYKAEVLVVNDPKWYDNATRFATWGEAHDYGLDLGNRWFAVKEMRVAESDDPVNYQWVDGRLEAAPIVQKDTVRKDKDGMDWSLVDERS